MTTTDRTAGTRRRGLGIARAAGALVAVGALVAACSSSAGASGTTPTSAPAATQASSPAAASAAPASAAPSTAGAAQNVTMATGSVGTFLAGGNGMTLYTYKKDTTPGTSACTAGCATNWPPFKLGAGETVQAGTGVTGTFATIKRDDGSDQVTYNGAPLYYFVGDTKAGDTSGQGLNNVWYVASPTGSAPGGSASPSPAKVTY